MTRQRLQSRPVLILSSQGNRYVDERRLRSQALYYRRKGWSPAEIAELLGIDRPWVSALLRNKVK